MTNFNESHFETDFIETDQYMRLEKLYSNFPYASPMSVYSVPYGFPPTLPQMQSTRNLLTIPVESTNQDSTSDVPRPSSSAISYSYLNKDQCSDDEDMSGEEEDLDSMNPYFGIINSRSPTKRPPNWRSLILFNGRINPDDLPNDFPKPQNSDGAFLPKVRRLVLNSINSNVKFAGKYTMQYPGGIPKESKAENYGYVSANGRTWFRKKPTDAPTTPKTPINSTPPTRKRFANQSLVIAGGKRIYTDNSKECIAYAQSGNCLANNLCAYEHDGNADHQSTKLCRDQMLGSCRNDSNCPKGYHGLSAHQIPVCHYFLRMTCVHDNCPYLHIKHQDTLDNCLMFQKGLCLAGLKCSKPHRYNQRVLSTKCNQDLAARSGAPNEGPKIIADESVESKEMNLRDELPTWHF